LVLPGCTSPEAIELCKWVAAVCTNHVCRCFVNSWSKPV